MNRPARHRACPTAAARSAIHRLRERFHAIFRAESAHTVNDPAEVDNEIRHLFNALAGQG